MLPGMPYIYQGEEIGMTNVKFASIDDYDDIWMKHKYQEILLSAKSAAERELAFDELRHSARDNARTPMQWSAEANGGFSTAQPWLAVNPNYKTINVRADRAGSDSIFRYYQQLIALRKALIPVLVYGDYREIDCRDARLYSFERFNGADCIRVALNISADEVQMPEGCLGWGELLGNYGKMRHGVLRPYEALIVKKIIE